MSDYIPPPTVQQLLAELNEVDWYVFGVALGVPVPTLREIQASNSQSGVQRCKIDMFQTWHDSTPTASWEDIIRALEQLNNRTLAARLRSRQQLSPAATVSTLTSASGAEIPANVEVVQRLQGLESHFSNMLTNIRRFYTNCDLAEMQFFLDDLLETEKFSNCVSFDEILRQLRHSHVDTFNIYYLEQLGARFQGDEVDELIDEYNEKKEAFLTETVVTEFHEAIASRVRHVLPEEMVTITIKIPQSLANERTLKDMERLAGRAFGHYYKSLVNLHVVPGSIVITWFFPKSLTDELERQAQANGAVFKQEGVEEVAVAGRVVFPSEEDLHREKVQQAIHTLIERADQITAQGREVEQQILHTTQQAVEALQKSASQLQEMVKTAVQQKLQILSQQREVAKGSMVLQTSIKEEDEQQDSAVKHHAMEHLKMAASLLQPLEEANIDIFFNEKVLPECSDLGEVTFTLSITSQVVTEGKGTKFAVAGQETSFELTTLPSAAPPVLLPLKLLSCQLIVPNSSQPVECTITPTQSRSYTVKYTPAVRGFHKLRITVGGHDIPNSPLTIRVLPSLDRPPLRTIAEVDSPHHVAVSVNGEVAVSEYNSKTIHVFNREGIKISLFDFYSQKEQGCLNGIAFTHDGHHLLAIDAQYRKLHMFTLNGKLVKSVGERGDGPLKFNFPRGIAVHPSGSMLIADSCNNRIQVLNSDLSFSHMFGNQESGPKQFHHLHNVAIDSRGDVYVVDVNVWKCSFDGEIIREVGVGTLSTQPLAICIDSTGMVYVSKQLVGKASLHSVEVFDSNGLLCETLMKGSKAVLGMTVDRDDNLFVCKSGKAEKFVYIY